MWSLAAPWLFLDSSVKEHCLVMLAAQTGAQSLNF